MTEVVTIGETMVLFSPICTGSLQYVNYFQKQIGGAESNFAIGIVRLGHTAGWISKVGDDPFGKYLVSFIRGEGVDTSRVRVDNEAPTAVYFKEFHEMKDPKVYYYRAGSAASRISPEDLDEDYIREAKILHLTGITPALGKSARDTVYKAIDIARKHGLIVSFDPNIRKKLWSEEECRSTILDIASKVDIIMPGLEEARFLLGEGDPEDYCRKFLDMGIKTVAMKMGKDGCIVADKGIIQRVAGRVVAKVVDPVGAGDGFDAGFITGILNGWDIIECARLANDVGAFVITVNGDVEGLPTMREIMELRGEFDTIDR
ncbi:MAG: sugar kinase [Thermoanaerobacteraceae bacterium]|nr:sugar kinase [Thermoanaerobacteraceae bacterium]